MQITIIAIDAGATFAGAVIRDGAGPAALGKRLARTKRALEGMYGEISDGGAAVRCVTSQAITSCEPPDH